MTVQHDEETPLLQNDHTPKAATPLPMFQFSIVLFLQLAEPLTSQVIYPFAPQLMRDIGITHGDESKVGYYVGLMQSLFYVTQALTVLHWSRLSDRIGRKPVVLTGLLGLSISMYCFGLSKTFWGLVLSRSLNGALNGNIGVIKSMMADLTDPTNIAQAYAYMPIAWSTGGILGPIIGGLLARPAERFPDLFGKNEFLKEYPYFLPCAVPATFSLLAWIVTYLFLKETVSSPISFAQLIRLKRSKPNLQNVDSSHEPTSATDPTRRTTPPTKEQPLPLRSLLIPRVLIAAGNYACLSLIDISFRAIQPVFYSTSVELGGLGLPPSAIGKILSSYGILTGIFQVFFFAGIHDRWGSKTVFITGIAAAIPAFTLFPVINTIAKTQGVNYIVWLLVSIQVIVSILISLSYGAIFIFISAASPNRASLGATNGISQMSVSIMRAIGPASTNSLFSLSIAKGYLGGHLVYYVLLGVAFASLVVASFLPKRIWTN